MMFNFLCFIELHSLFMFKFKGEKKIILGKKSFYCTLTTREAAPT